MNETISRKLLIINSDDEKFTQPVIEILSGFDALGVVFATKLIALAEIKKGDIDRALKFQPDVIFMKITPEAEVFCLRFFKALSSTTKKKVFYQGDGSQLLNSAGAVHFSSAHLNDINDRGKDYLRFLLLVKARLGLEENKKKATLKKGKNKRIAVFYSSKACFEERVRYLLDHLHKYYGYSFDFEYLYSEDDGNITRAAQLKNNQADIVFVEGVLLLAGWFINGYNDMPEQNRNHLIVFGEDNLAERIVSRTKLFNNLYVENENKLPLILYLLNNL